MYVLERARCRSYRVHAERDFITFAEVVFVVVYVNNFAQKEIGIDLREIFSEGWQWASEQMINFRWRSRTDSPDGGTDIATLVRRALAEVCPVPVLLVC